jgi:hypothetical protein
MRVALRQGKEHVKSKKCYRPFNVLSSFLAEALLLEEEADKIQKEITVGGGGKTKTKQTDSTIISKQKEWRLKKRNLDKRKVKVLDNVIFPSMANLTVLLEAITDSRFIGHMFEDDVKSLLFSKSKALSVKSKVVEERHKASRSIFTRFVNACSALTLYKHETKEWILLDESRLILCDIMQEAVYQALQSIGPFKFEDTDFLQKTLFEDMGRMHAWTTLLARGASKELSFDEDKRPALF